MERPLDAFPNGFSRIEAVLPKTQSQRFTIKLCRARRGRDELERLVARQCAMALPALMNFRLLGHQQEVSRIIVGQELLSRVQISFSFFQSLHGTDLLTAFSAVRKVFSLKPEKTLFLPLLNDDAPFRIVPSTS
jgi:hypothetical protein